MARKQEPTKIHMRTIAITCCYNAAMNSKNNKPPCQKKKQETKTKERNTSATAALDSAAATARKALANSFPISSTCLIAFFIVCSRSTARFRTLSRCSCSSFLASAHSLYMPFGITTQLKLVLHCQELLSCNKITCMGCMAKKVCNLQKRR